LASTSMRFLTRRLGLTSETTARRSRREVIMHIAH
jgi:hypothetical protein